MAQRVGNAGILALLILAGTVFWYLSAPLRVPDSVCRDLACISMNDIYGYRLKEMYTDTPQVFRALYASGNRLLRINAQSSPPQASAQEQETSITQMKSLFEKAPAPYPGDISDAIVCDPQYRPSYYEVQNKNLRISYFVGYLNDRLTFGSCSKDQATYRGILAFAYCPGRSIRIRLELIAPTEEFLQHETEFTNQIATLACQDQ